MKSKNRKYIIIISIVLILVIAVAFFIIKFSSTGKVEKDKSKKSNSTEIVDKNKSDTKNATLNEEEQEINDESKTEDSSSKSTTSANVNNESTGTDNTTNNKSTISSGINSSAPQSSTSQQDTTPSQNTQTVQTEWEKLGISEYAYYHTPMNDGEEVVFEGNESLCTAEINRLVDKYYREGLSGGNSYTINGKYTYSYIGCGINIFINGEKYKYSQVVAMGYK